MKPPPANTRSLKNIARSYGASFASYGLIDLGIVAALETAAFGMLTPVLPLYLKHEIGASSEKIGLTFTVFFIALAMGEFGWGMLSDRIGIKKPLIIGTFLAALTTAGFVLTRNINLIYAINFMRALGTSALFPTARGHIGSTVPVKTKATFMAYYMTLQSLGRAIGAFIGGLAGEKSLALVFYLAGGSLLAACTVATLGFKGNIFKVSAVREATTDTKDPHVKPGTGKGYIGGLVVLGLTIALFNLSFTIRNSFLPLYAESAGLSVAQVGFLFTAWSLVNLACTMPAGHLADRIGWQNAMIAGQVILAVTMAAFAYADTFALLMLIMIINSLSNCFFRPAASARFSELMPRRRQATAMGILGVFEDMGNIVGPTVAGFLWEVRNGPALTFLFGGACAFIGAVTGFLKLSGKKRNDR